MSSNFVKGPVQMFSSSLFFAFMAFFAKLASARIPGAEVAFIRFIAGVAAALILASFGRIDLRTRNKGLLIVRGFFGGGAVLLYFIALAGGSLSNSTILNNTYPIFATLIAAFTLKERISRWTGLSLLIAWVGVWFLIHPDLQHLFWPDWVGLLSGVLAGVAVAIVRELRQKNEPAWTVFFYLSIFGCFFSLVVAFPVWVWPDGKDGILLLATAGFGLIAQLMMTSAYKYCSTVVGGILSMATMVFTAIIGIMILGEKPTLGEVGGALLITLGSILVVWFTNKTKVSIQAETVSSCSDSKSSQ